MDQEEQVKIARSSREIRASTSDIMPPKLSTYFSIGSSIRLRPDVARCLLIHLIFTSHSSNQQMRYCSSLRIPINSNWRYIRGPRAPSCVSTHPKRIRRCKRTGITFWREQCIPLGLYKTKLGQSLKMLQRRSSNLPSQCQS